MKRVLVPAVGVLLIAAPASAAPAGSPPAGMTSTCTVVRSGNAVTESGVLRYADGSAAPGWSVDVIWQDPTRAYWAVPVPGVTSGVDGSWSLSYTVNDTAAPTSTVSVVVNKGSKVSRRDVATCGI